MSKRRNSDASLRAAERRFMATGVGATELAKELLRSGQDREQATAFLRERGFALIEAHETVAEVSGMPLVEWKLINYGVTGNYENGYEINDIRYTGDAIMLPADASYSEAREALVTEGLVSVDLGIDVESSSETNVVFFRPSDQRPAGALERATRRNTDTRTRDLERLAMTGDVDALTTFADHVGRRMGDWAWVTRAVIAAGPSATNAFMDRTDFPTWNRLAPAVYAGAAGWPEADLVRAQEILHELLLDRAWVDDASWEACTFPVFAVLIGDLAPARMVDDPDGIPRLLSYRAGDPRGAWSVCRRWRPREQITSFPEEFATIFLAVLDEERGAATCATSTVQGGAGTHFSPSWVTHWSVGRGLGSRDYSSRREQDWLEWARETDPWDRLILPLPVLRAWFRRAQAFLARQRRPNIGGVPTEGAGGAVEIVGGEPNPPRTYAYTCWTFHKFGERTLPECERRAHGPRARKPFTLYAPGPEGWSDDLGPPEGEVRDPGPYKRRRCGPCQAAYLDLEKRRREERTSENPYCAAMTNSGEGVPLSALTSLSRDRQRLLKSELGWDTVEAFLDMTRDSRDSAMRYLRLRHVDFDALTTEARSLVSAGFLQRLDHPKKFRRGTGALVPEDRVSKVSFEDADTVAEKLADMIGDAGWFMGVGVEPHQAINYRGYAVSVRYKDEIADTADVPSEIDGVKVLFEKGESARALESPRRNPRNRPVVSRFDVWTAKVPALFKPRSWDDLAPSGRLMSKIGSDLPWDAAVEKARRFNASMVEHQVSFTDVPEGEEPQVCDKRTTHGVRPWAVVVGAGSGRVGDAFGPDYSQQNLRRNPDDFDYESLDIDCDEIDGDEDICDEENEECMNVVYAHPSGGLLWQGGKSSCVDCQTLDNLGIKVVVLAAMEHQPSLPHHIDVVRARLDDDFRMKRPMAVEVARCVDEVSDILAERIRRGEHALSSCFMGWNRSGIVSAMTVIKLTGCRPDQAIGLVRGARGPNALSNPVFVAIIMALGAR